MIPAQTLYTRTGDKNTIYLNQAIKMCIRDRDRLCL